MPYLAMGETPFRLTYKADVAIFIEIEELSSRILLSSKVLRLEGRCQELNLLPEV